MNRKKYCFDKNDGLAICFLTKLKKIGWNKEYEIEFF
jgi:hypothetical protein